jgi:hypothetical protein
MPIKHSNEPNESSLKRLKEVQNLDGWGNSLKRLKEVQNGDYKISDRLYTLAAEIGKELEKQNVKIPRLSYFEDVLEFTFDDEGLFFSYTEVHEEGEEEELDLFYSSKDCGRGHSTSWILSEESIAKEIVEKIQKARDQFREKTFVSSK